MPQYTTLPPDLADAIRKASEANAGVTPGTLAGIWAIEAGRTYPNPAVNSKGYGGLFGTPNSPSQGAPFANFDFTATTQQQADLAAGILKNLLAQYNGDLSTALYHYSGGGYTSVPNVPLSGPSNPIASAGSAIAGAGSAVINAPGNAAHDVTKALTGWVGDLTTWIEQTATRGLLYLVLTFGAFALILLGLNRASGGAIRRTVQGASIGAAAAV